MVQPPQADAYPQQYQLDNSAARSKKGHSGGSGAARRPAKTFAAAVGCAALSPLRGGSMHRVKKAQIDRGVREKRMAVKKRECVSMPPDTRARGAMDEGSPSIPRVVRFFFFSLAGGRRRRRPGRVFGRGAGGRARARSKLATRRRRVTKAGLVAKQEASLSFLLPHAMPHEAMVHAAGTKRDAHTHLQKC
jgi:hypothetical protein